MARRRAPDLPVKAVVTLPQLRAVLPRLERRVEELRSLDPESITERGDPRVQAVEDKIEDTLVEIFGNDSVEHRRYSVVPLDSAGWNSMYETPLHEVREGYRRSIEQAIAKLTTIIELFQERLQDAPVDQAANLAQEERSQVGRKVFVVHGHDEGAKQQVARFLDHLDLEPVILHEQPNQGMTIIEKFVASADVDFAVVILTHDDIGYPSGREDEAKPRARQNVVFELGFFVAKLGRGKVVALCQTGIEIPSDYHGVAYTIMDDRGAWKLEVAREIRQAGINVDLNCAI